MAGDGIWYARSQLVKLLHRLERRKNRRLDILACGMPKTFLPIFL
jgi:hypothetical protein